MCHSFAKNPEHVIGLDEEDESTLRNHRVLYVALRFRSMSRDNITPENAIALADAIINFLSGVKDEEEIVTTTTTHIDAATTSTIEAMRP
ncbi:hypothetical protein Sjap_011063 [Stephania japonica]|uniref:Uncharacterized protein n=1 Tax=Stephania japonica TaxID=461633 RepID=A0AAP0JCM6_9MAGN